LNATIWLTSVIGFTFQRKWWFRNCLPNLGVHLLLQVVVSLLLFNFPVVSFGVFSVLHVLEVLRKRVDPDSFSKHVRDLALAHEDAIVFEQFFDLHAVELQRAVWVELHEHLIDYFFSFYLCRRVEVVGVRVGWSVRLKPLFEFVAVQQCVRFFLRDDDGGPRINLLQTLNRLQASQFLMNSVWLLDNFLLRNKRLIHSFVSLQILKQSGRIQHFIIVNKQLALRLMNGLGSLLLLTAFNEAGAASGWRRHLSRVNEIVCALPLCLPLRHYVSAFVQLVGLALAQTRCWV
jgi:hypothetical protein